MSKVAKCAVLICVGPGERELSRLKDVLESVAAFEPTAEIVLVDDEPKRDLSSYCNRVIDNPRGGKGCGWGAGLTVGILAGYKTIAKEFEHIDFVLKLDTDSLITAPFAQRIREMMEMSRADALGCFKHYPHRKRDNHYDRSPAPAIAKICKAFTIWRRTSVSNLPYLQSWLCSSDRQLSSIIRQAIANGYIPGEYICGGGYAVKQKALASLCNAGLLDQTLKWLRTPLGEDITTSILLKSINCSITDFCGQGGVFGVGDPSLPFEPSELVAKGYAVVHPVKTSDSSDEASLRNVFRDLRKNN